MRSQEMIQRSCPCSSHWGIISTAPSNPCSLNRSHLCTGGHPPPARCRSYQGKPSGHNTSIIPHHGSRAKRKSHMEAIGVRSVYGGGFWSALGRCHLDQGRGPRGEICPRTRGTFRSRPDVPGSPTASSRVWGTPRPRWHSAPHDKLGTTPALPTSVTCARHREA
jgi:hypothetical protein